MMEYRSIRQISEKWGISVRRIQVLCVEHRIPGAVKIRLLLASLNCRIAPVTFLKSLLKT